MLYLSVILISLLLAFISQKYNNKFLIYVIIIIVSLLSGLRGVDVGKDTKMYYLIIDEISNKDIGIYGTDFGFTIATKILLNIFEKKENIILIYAFITNFLIIIRLWSFRRKSSVPLMLFIYFALYYPYTFNIMRQYIAIAIVFYSTIFLEKKQLVNFIILNIIAASIHTTSIISFLLPIIYKNKLEKKIILYQLTCVSIILPMSFYMFHKNLFRYLVYLKTPTISVNFTTIIFFLCFIILVCLSHKKIEKEIMICYFMGLILLTTNMFFMYMSRISFYYALYCMPFWGQAINKSKNKFLYIPLICIIICIFMFSLMISDRENLLWEYRTIFD